MHLQHLAHHGRLATRTRAIPGQRVRRSCRQVMHVQISEMPLPREVVDFIVLCIVHGNTNTPRLGTELPGGRI